MILGMAAMNHAWITDEDPWVVNRGSKILVSTSRGTSEKTQFSFKIQWLRFVLVFRSALSLFWFNSIDNHESSLDDSVQETWKTIWKNQPYAKIVVTVILKKTRAKLFSTKFFYDPCKIINYNQWRSMQNQRSKPGLSVWNFFWDLIRIKNDKSLEITKSIENIWISSCTSVSTKTITVILNQFI